MRLPLEIYFTVDTEASIAGAFTQPDKFAPMLAEPVDGVIDGKSHALGFLLETLQKYGLTATFFTESLQNRYFGIEPMQRRVDQILSAGQDVQLHVHPCWLNFENGKLIGKTQNDKCTGHAPEKLTEIFATAYQHFCDWGFGKPVAVRTGNFSTGLDTFPACKAAGLAFSSNIAAGLHYPSAPQLQHFYGFQNIAGVTELPLTSFNSFSVKGRRSQRIMAITACSFSEMRSALLQAYEYGLDAVCILTHPFEFTRFDNVRYLNLRPNPLVQGRFDRLCAFIANHGDKFKTSTFGGLVGKPITYQVRPKQELACGYLQMLKRSAENVLN